MHKEYTKKAKRVLELTRKAAAMLHHNYIGTEHLLIALLKEGTGVAACVLMDAGVEENRLMDLVEELIAPSSPIAVIDKKGYSPRLLHVLESAEKEAERFKTEKTETEHLLLHSDGLNERRLDWVRVRVKEPEENE